MKPNFALTLSFDGIGLLHRSDGGWLSVGDVPLNDPDLAGGLKALLGKAGALDAGTITTKLVIPNQQIRYLTFESDSRDIDILEAQVRSTLHGATPYHVSELAYDWSMTGGEVCVAAVAIETLTEAESFAVDHGFSPMSFVAVPEEGEFQGEPFFGETVHAGDILTPGDSVDRDEHVIVVIGTASLPEPEVEPEPEAELEADLTPDPMPLAGFQSTRRAPPPVEANEQAPEVTQAATPDAIPPETSNAEPTVAFSSARTAPAPPSSDEAPPTSQSAPDLPQSRFSPATEDAPDAENADTKTDPDAAPKPDALEPAPPVSTAPSSPPLDLASVAASKAAPDPKPEELAAEDLAAVAQARSDTFKEPPAATPEAPIRPLAAPAAPASNHPGRLAFLSQRKTEPGTPAAPSSGPVRSARDRAQAAGSAITASLSSSLNSGIASGLKAKLRSGFGSGLRSGLAKSRSAASGVAGAASNLRTKSATAAAPDDPAARAMEDERQRMTVFGARNPDNTTTETSPRFMALALTAGLLFVLVGIAAWAAIFLDDGLSSLFRSSEDVQFAEDPAAIEAPEEVAPGAETEIAALPQDPATETARDTEDLADDALDTLRPGDPISEELSPDEARARYAATGIWQMSPRTTRAPREGQFQDVYQTSLDPDVRFSDAVALPQVAALLPSPQPFIPGAPLPPGTDDVARDARGFVLATPEGTVSPDRLITIFTGPPPLIPPATPERAEPEVVEVALAPEPATATSDVDAGLRPRARPAGISETNERSNNAGRTLDELQQLRPRLRPQSAQEQALSEAGISTQIEDDDGDLFDAATAQAVQRSLTPRTRPANFAAIVDQSRQTAASEPVSVEQRVSVDIPTTASVARAATERNQISLRRVNLIGVYGSEGNRRALVRLPNGRYRKVEVGDRLDGGQVAAIGNGELRYIKSGQSVVLKMPNS